MARAKRGDAVGSTRAEPFDDGDADPATVDDGPSGLAVLFEPRPRFRRVLRGYDRAEVDDYVAAVERERLETAPLEAPAGRCSHCNDEFPAAPAAPALLGGADGTDDRDAVLVVGAMRELLRLAEDRAGELVADAEAEAERVRAAARAEADARLGNVAEVRRAAQAARREAEIALAHGRQQAADLLRAAAGDRAGLDAEAAAVRDRAAEDARREAEQAALDAAEELAAVRREIDDLCRQRDEARSSLRRLTGQIDAALQAFAAPVPDEVHAGGRPREVVVTGNVVLAEPREPVAG
ncbi:DivIVA domain-containing protein [Geodermatophilus sabuli]|uniref:DivIVA domain-containing protein n=1 Tax=Geodermatophilus sabuli TaxID=1564158 RepID=A0A7K3W1D9_9ACTN|nr:DivIVA domain-containing protein [Geodermatophilus sabuli]NEK58675.1 DivIVA domain-containing protein [Geodermatophilus sabuli]